MKKLSLLFIAAIAMIGCSDDDSAATSINETSLQSKWKPSAVTYQGETTDISDPCPQNGIIWLKENGNITEYISTGQNCTTTTDNYNYEISGNVITLQDADYSTKANITVVNDDTIKLEWFYDSDEGEYPQNERETVWYDRID